MLGNALAERLSFRVMSSTGVSPILPAPVHIGLRPASVLHWSLEALLDDETPTRFFGATRAALQSNDQLFKFVTG
jgi:hypothetical protein